tara:strand:- start:34 stop:612 length:579 start_codon:yes stop_codon:yes gene_type:complete
LNEIIEERLIDGAELMQKIAKNRSLVVDISKAVEMCSNSISSGGKILFMGNGGSAADSQHLATELVSRYLLERGALPALALTVDTSAITAIGNDYSFDSIFSRQIEALCKDVDVVIGISTSGNSKNVIKGVEAANLLGAKTISLTGNGGGELSQKSSHSIVVPSESTPLIQQAHISIGHILCELLETSQANH